VEGRDKWPRQQEGLQGESVHVHMIEKEGQTRTTKMSVSRAFGRVRNEVGGRETGQACSGGSCARPVRTWGALNARREKICWLEKRRMTRAGFGGREAEAATRTA
jgi:hypothetical protein